MLARFQHQLRRIQNRLRGNLLGLRAIKPFGHAGVAAFAYYQRNSSSPKRFRRYSFSSPSAVSGSSSKRTSILSMRKPSITRAIIVIFVPS